MTYPSKPLVTCLLILCGLFGLAHWLVPASFVFRNTFPLGPVREATMNPGEIHRYMASLKKGDFLRATVDQAPVRGKEIDVSIQIWSPRDTQLCEIDSPRGAEGSEEVYLFAEQDGVFKLDIGGSGKGGTYRIRRLVVRHGSPSDHKEAEAECLYFRGRAKKRAGDLAGAVIDLLAAEQRWNELGNIARRADALSEVGLCSSLEGRIAESLKLRLAALALYRSLGDLKKESALLVAVGLAQKRLGDLEQAEESVREALMIAQRTGNKFVETDAYDLLGSIAEQKGDEFSALDFFEKALSGWRVQPGREAEQVTALESLGRINSVLGNPRDAMEWLEKAEQVAEQINNQDLRGECLAHMAEELRIMKKPEIALSYALKALTLRKAANNPLGLANNLNAIALIYCDLKRLDEARADEEEALAIYRRRKAPRGEATAHYHLGLILLRTKDRRGAIDHFQRAVDLAHRVNFIEGEIAGRYGLALGYKLIGDLATARSQVEIALNLIEGASTVAASAGTGSAFMESRFGSFQLLIDLLAQSPSISEQDKKEALEASERARWRVLLDSFHHKRKPTGSFIDEGLASELEKAKSQLTSSESERKKAEATGKSTKEIQEVQDRLSRKIQMQEARMRSHVLVPKAVPVTLTTVQSLLGSDTILLAYFLGTSRSVLWRITATSNEMFIIAGRGELERLCRHFHLLLSNPGPYDPKRIDAATEEVSKLLLGPVAGRLNAKRIVVVADGPLNYVPFGLLRDPKDGLKVEGSASFLLQTREVVYEPSMSVLHAIRQEIALRRSPPSLLAVIANPKFPPGGYSPLPFSGEEAQTLMAMVPKEKGFAAVGCKATRKLLMSKDFSAFRFLHLATHGEDHPGLPALSGIALSPSDCEGRRLDDGILRLQDIKALDLPLDMVVLSACRTALGKEVEGEGFEGLTEGFIAAGSARVVASLWNVDDHSVTILMKQFYKSLIEDNLSPSQALRVAQLSMAKEERWKSPYYWAGFKLHGEWRRDP